MLGGEPPTGAVLALATAMATVGLAGVAAPAGADHGRHQGDVAVESPVDGADIWITICKPDGVTADTPAPVVLHGHGWSGSRTGDCSSFDDWLADGFAVASIDQRGHGDSGGQTHVMDPDLEGQDLEAVVDHLAGIPWVARDAPGDPVLGAIGGSYGGAYQFTLALTETLETGSTRVDAMAPQITWYDLVESLAPNQVIRSAWVDALYAGGTANADMHRGIHEAFAYGLATGQLPDGSVPGVHDIQSDFRENGPVGFVEDERVRLDVPVLMRQGTTDNLFPLNEAWHNFERTLTDDAREDSALIGYNGGHALPNVLPPGQAEAGDPCSAAYGGFDELTRSFFRAAFAGEADRPTPAPYLVATRGGECLPLDELAPDTTVDVGPQSLAATTTGAGAPQYLPVQEGPVTVAGIPSFEATVLSGGVDQRAFLGFAVGESPATATVVNNNLYPVRTAGPGVHEVATELAGVAVDVQDGETMYLVVSPVSDVFAHHGSRTPGGMVFQDTRVALPVVG